MIRYILFLFFLFFTTCNAAFMSQKCEKVYVGYVYRYSPSVYKRTYMYTYRYYARRYYYPILQFECKDIPSPIAKIEFNAYTLSSNSHKTSDLDLVIMKKCGEAAKSSSAGPAGHTCEDTGTMEDLYTDDIPSYTSRSKVAQEITSSVQDSPVVGGFPKGNGLKTVSFNSSVSDLQGTFKIAFSMREPENTYTYHYLGSSYSTKPWIDVFWEQPPSCYSATYARSNYRYTSTIFVGASATIECADGYELVDPLDNFVNCMEDDTFDRTNLCRYSTCPIPATPINSESVEIFDDLEEPTDRFHNYGYYKYKCNEGYRATVSNPTDSIDGRTGLSNVSMGCYIEMGQIHK